ncbi:MAG: hypothetical protein IJ132_05575 [Firmicutes bacterium]|nr:hypothetical protein [Bacillota bacterium]
MSRTEELYNLMIDRGYPEEFAKLVSREMNTEYTSQRMIRYIAVRGLAPLEEVADEMQAVLSERDKLVNKHISRHAQESINRFYMEHDPHEAE